MSCTSVLKSMEADRFPPQTASAYTTQEVQQGSTVCHCSTCQNRSVCMPPDLAAIESSHLDSIISATRVVREAQALYRTGSIFRSIYAVRSGSFKTEVSNRDGLVQITGLKIAGDLLGLGGVFSDRYTCDAIALEDSTVCVIPYSLLEGVCHDLDVMQRHVHRMLSREIVRGSNLMMLLGTMTEEQRVAAFLLDLLRRHRARGYSATEISLRMTRREIGNFLGLKLETVSRAFSKLQRKKLIETERKEIRILNLAALESL